jgi:hypothetical protein
MQSCIRDITSKQSYFGPSQQPFKYIFVRKDTPTFCRIKGYFTKYITPLYGPQKRALEKIALENDRACELLQDDHTKEDLGILVYKTNLTNEFSPLGATNTLEIKTLFLIDPQNFSGKGIASTLLHRIADKALKKKASSIWVSVSSGKPETIAFFLSRGFQIKKVQQDLYVSGLDEFFLSHNDPLHLKNELETRITTKNKNKTSTNIFDYFLLHHEHTLPLKQSKKTDSSNQLIFLSQEPLLSVDQKLLGHLFIGVDYSGKRSFVGFLPNKPVNLSYWHSLLSNIIDNIDLIHIACIKNKELIKALFTKYPNLRLCHSYSFKNWSINDFDFDHTYLTTEEFDDFVHSLGSKEPLFPSLKNRKRLVT